MSWQARKRQSDLREYCLHVDRYQWIKKVLMDWINMGRMISATPNLTLQQEVIHDAESGIDGKEIRRGDFSRKAK
jgi:hypothetical protein